MYVFNIGLQSKNNSSQLLVNIECTEIGDKNALQFQSADAGIKLLMIWFLSVGFVFLKGVKETKKASMAMEYKTKG
jgi:hypothetical protein